MEITKFFFLQRREKIAISENSNIAKSCSYNNRENMKAILES